MEHCKVIITCGSQNRKVRREAKYPDHNQSLTDHGDYLNMWSFIHKQEVKWDGGMPFDTLIICNDTIAYDAWKYMDGDRTRNGRYNVMLRDNDGGSFGGYNYAFKNTDYNYYLFTEDDLIVYGDKYYKTIVETYHSHPKPVFVGLIGISQFQHYAKHCHGGVGFTSRHVLNSIRNQAGDLPCPRSGWNREEAIREGEVPFTAKMFEAGYDLVTVKPIEGWSPDNLIMPYYEIREN